MTKKKIAEKGDVKRIVSKTFTKKYFAVCCKIRARVADCYSGLSKRNVSDHKPPIHARMVPCRNKVLRELTFLDFSKFSEIREKLFCRKSRILSNLENKFLQKVFIFYYMASLNAFFSSFWEKKFHLTYSLPSPSHPRPFSTAPNHCPLRTFT